MKIRIQGNSIRLRLSQSDVKHFAETGVVEDRIQFGLSPGESLVYRLEQGNDRQFSASFSHNQIRVQVPADAGADWAATEQVGMESEIPLDGNTRLRILVEKDFKCLTERAGEDESDNFPNPDGCC